MDLFHYTDALGLEGIKKERFIKASDGRRGKFGKGVYFTTAEPDQDRKITAMENYCSGGDVRYKQGKLDHYIRIKIPLTDERLKKVQSRGSDIYLFKENRIRLDEFDWDSGENSAWSTLGKLALMGAVVGIAALALNHLAKKSQEEEKTVEDKLRDVLGEFQRMKTSQSPLLENEDDLSVFAPDCNGKASIWCTKCFVQVCPGFQLRSDTKAVSKVQIHSHLQDHINESLHRVNTPGTNLNARFRDRVKEMYGEGNEEVFFKLDHIINSYQNANWTKPWIHRLRVEKLERDDRIGIYVLCTRCDLAASSVFWMNEGTGGFEEQTVHQEIQAHFDRNIFNFH